MFRIGVSNRRISAADAHRAWRDSTAGEIHSHMGASFGPPLYPLRTPTNGEISGIRHGDQHDIKVGGIRSPRHGWGFYEMLCWSLPGVCVNAGDSIPALVQPCLSWRDPKGHHLDFHIAPYQ